MWVDKVIARSDRVPAPFDKVIDPNLQSRPNGPAITPVRCNWTRSGLGRICAISLSQTGGFAHLLCQNRAITLSKAPVLGLFWRNNFVTLQNLWSDKVIEQSDKVIEQNDKVIEQILWLDAPAKRFSLVEGSSEGSGLEGIHSVTLSKWEVLCSNSGKTYSITLSKR